MFTGNQPWNRSVNFLTVWVRECVCVCVHWSYCHVYRHTCDRRLNPFFVVFNRISRATCAAKHCQWAFANISVFGTGLTPPTFLRNSQLGAKEHKAFKSDPKLRLNKNGKKSTLASSCRAPPLAVAATLQCQSMLRELVQLFRGVSLPGSLNDKHKGVKSTRHVPGAFTVGRNFSLHPLHPQKWNISCTHSSTCDATVSPPPSHLLPTHVAASPTRRPARPAPTLRGAQLEEHSCSLTSVNFITSASESRTQYI